MAHQSAITDHRVGAVAVSWNLDAGIWHVELTGQYSLRDVMEVWETILAQASAPKTRPRILVDVSRSAALMSVRRGDMERAAETFGPRLAGASARCAVVARSDARFGLMRQACSLMDRFEPDVGVFRYEADALEWLSAS